MENAVIAVSAQAVMKLPEVSQALVSITDVMPLLWMPVRALLSCSTSHCSLGDGIIHLLHKGFENIAFAMLWLAAAHQQQAQQSNN